MATSTGQKWLIGCGVGCGVLVLVAAMAGTGACYMFKDIAEEFEEVKASHDAVVAEFGEHDQFTPAADGSVAPERMQAFLAVRAGMQESRAKLHELFAKFPPDEDNGFMMFFKVIGGMAGMIDDAVAYIDARNNVLMDNGIGYGEYLYIYTSVYYAWLERDLADGPMHDGQRIFDGGDSTFGVNQSYKSYRKFMLAVLRNQLDALPEEADDAWRARLLQEIDATDRDRQHIVWRGDLPPALEASIEPFRAELEASYDEMTNCFELPTDEHQTGGRVQWSIE
jgi:hypothetical protein